MKQAPRMLLAVMIFTMALSACDAVLVRAQPPRPRTTLPLPATPTPTAANSGWVVRNPLPQSEPVRSGRRERHTPDQH
jgi:hypothetical protein